MKCPIAMRSKASAKYSICTYTLTWDNNFSLENTVQQETFEGENFVDRKEETIHRENFC